MHLHDLPLAAFEVENVGCARCEALLWPVHGHLRSCPPYGSFLPGLDPVPGDGHPAQLLELTPPDGVGLRAAPPLLRIGADCQHAGVLRHFPEDCVGVALAIRDHPPIDDAADLLGRLHAAECARADDRPQGRTLWRQASRSQEMQDEL